MISRLEVFEVIISGVLNIKVIKVKKFFSNNRFKGGCCLISFDVAGRIKHGVDYFS